MASRQEEKEQRRIEREQAEAKDRAAAGRRKRMNMVLGGLIGLLVIAGAVFAIISAAGGGDDKPEPGGTPDEEEVAKLLPEQETQDLDEAVKLSGCKIEHPKYEGAGHEEKEFTAADYKTNPPTSGAHFPTWYEDGIYAPGNVDNLGMLVHTLEHGRINVQYKPGTPAATIDVLEAFFVEKSEYHMLVYENTTNMEPQIAVTAWTHLLTCDTYKPEVVDAMRAFYQKYVDKGPENVP